MNRAGLAANREGIVSGTDVDWEVHATKLPGFKMRFGWPISGIQHVVSK